MQRWCTFSYLSSVCSGLYILLLSLSYLWYMQVGHPRYMQYHRHFYVLHKSTKLFILCREFLWLVYRVCTDWLLKSFSDVCHIKCLLLHFTYEQLNLSLVYVPQILTLKCMDLSHLTFRLLCSTRVWNEYIAVCWILLVRISLSSQIQWLDNIKHTVWSGSNSTISLYMHTLKWWGPVSCYHITDHVELFFYLQIQSHHMLVSGKTIYCIPNGAWDNSGQLRTWFVPPVQATSWQILGINLPTCYRELHQLYQAWEALREFNGFWAAWFSVFFPINI